MAENTIDKHSDEEFDKLPLPQNFDDDIIEDLEPTSPVEEDQIQNQVSKTFSTAIFEERRPFKSQHRSGMSYYF